MSEDQPTPLRILAVDFSHMWHQCYMALGGDALSEAFKRTLERVTRAREGYDRVALMLDDGPSFRKAIDVGYKAKREPQDEAFYEQRRRCVERLEKEGCVGFIPPEVGLNRAGDDGIYFAEADDLCASLVAWCIAQGFPCDILTDDKDMMQLVDDEHAIRVVRPGNEKRSGPYDAARVEATFGAEKAGSWFGLSPARIVDWLALGGDKSDGYQAFPAWEDADGAHPGIGEGHAIAMIRGFGSALGAIDALEAGNPLIKGAILAAMSRGLPTPRAAVERCILLATLRRDLPVDWTPLLAEPVYAPLTDTRLIVDHGPAHAPPPVDAPEINGEPVPQKSTALARHTPIVSATIDRLALQPRNVEDLRLMAVDFFESRLYPKFPTWQSILVVMVEANERGIPVGLALRNCYVVHGTPAWSAVFLAALVVSSGRAKKFRIVETTAEKAVLEYQRIDESEPSYFEFTLEEARAAGWLKSGAKGDGKWITNPRTMCRHAVLREGARAFFFDVVAGMATPDEIRKDGTMTDDEWEGAEVVK